MEYLIDPQEVISFGHCPKYLGCPTYVPCSTDCKIKPLYGVPPPIEAQNSCAEILPLLLYFSWEERIFFYGGAQNFIS